MGKYQGFCVPNSVGQTFEKYQPSTDRYSVSTQSMIITSWKVMLYVLETFHVFAVTPMFASSYSMNDKVPKVKAAANKDDLHE